VRVLGTDPKDIDRAEDRHTFSKLLDTLGVDQPEWTEVTTPRAAAKEAARMGYPVLIRPSYVLSGSAMRVAHDEKSLIGFLKRAANVSSDHPVVISKFVENAREIEIDGVACKGKLAIYAISEHIENAGTHSGDATIVLPPQRTYLETIRRAKNITRGIIKSLKITGPFNIQFLAKDNHLMVIECNVRASRSFPFVSKVTGYNFIDIATRALLGEDVRDSYRTVELDCVAVKSPQFSYGRIKGADPYASVEMASTGEVAAFGDSYAEALLASMMAAGFRLPRKPRKSGSPSARAYKAVGGILVSLGKEENKVKLLPSIRILSDMGYNLYATEHTAEYLRGNGIECEHVYKVSTEKEPNISHMMESGAFSLIINVPTRAYQRENTDGFFIRRKAVDMNIPLITNRQLAEAFVTALAETKGRGLKARSWSEYREN
ncbi:MAG: ATP-grasp domain-containing protein, partial [bacterium]|nr:ATP-grasp domain-containing protein [bacterium]